MYTKKWQNGLALFAFLIFNSALLALGCASLPEPDSQGARLYVRYCSAEGCHGPILPQAGGRKYWDMQTERMFDIMQNKNWPLPTKEEKKRILTYLHKHAQGAAKK